MASIYNLKGVHKDGKAELKIGIDENSKIIDGIGDTVVFKNNDGTPAVISSKNIPVIPENASEENKLVTQNDLQEMSKKILLAMKAQSESMSALLDLAKIVNNIEED